MEHYINPYTDSGFKKLVGIKMSKDLLIYFLNALLHGEQVTGISDEEIENIEQLIR